MPYERASGIKDVRVPGSAQNLIRRESHKEGPTVSGRIPYEPPTGGGRMPYEPGFLMIRRDSGSVRMAGKEAEKRTRYFGGKCPASL